MPADITSKLMMLDILKTHWEQKKISLENYDMRRYTLIIELKSLLLTHIYNKIWSSLYDYIKETDVIEQIIVAWEDSIKIFIDDFVASSQNQNIILTKYKKELENLYSAVRSKLVHEFALRGSHAIFFYEKAHEDKIGIDLTVPKIIVNNTEIKGIPHINFLIPEYYRDFKTAIAKYYNDLKNWKNNQDILNKFLQATVDNFQSEEPK